LKSGSPIIIYEITKLKNYQIAEAAVTFDLSTLA
jgi:hypothetical protein